MIANTVDPQPPTKSRFRRHENSEQAGVVFEYGERPAETVGLHSSSRDQK